jgi:hypothetical protein
VVRDAFVADRTLTEDHIADAQFSGERAGGTDADETLHAECDECLEYGRRRRGADSEIPNHSDSTCSLRKEMELAEQSGDRRSPARRTDASQQTSVVTKDGAIWNSEIWDESLPPGICDEFLGSEECVVRVLAAKVGIRGMFHTLHATIAVTLDISIDADEKLRRSIDVIPVATDQRSTHARS